VKEGKRVNNKNHGGKTIYGIAATSVVLAGVSLMVISD
jgi:hypothetical protein